MPVHDVADGIHRLQCRSLASRKNRCEQTDAEADNRNDGEVGDPHVDGQRAYDVDIGGKGDEVKLRLQPTNDESEQAPQSRTEEADEQSLIHKNPPDASTPGPHGPQDTDLRRLYED